MTRKDMRNDFPLRGFVTCSSCLHPYTASWCKGKYEKHPYYHCATKGCPAYGKSVKRLDMEDNYKVALKKLKPKPLAINHAKVRALAAWKKKLKELESTKSGLLRSIDENEKQISILAGRVAANPGPTVANAYEKQIEKLAEENQKIQVKLYKIDHLEPDFGTALEEVLSFIKNPCDTWVNGDLETRNTISNMIFYGKPTYDRKTGFGTPDSSIAIKLFEQFDTSNSSEVDIPEKTWNTFEDYIFQWHQYIKGRNLMSRIHYQKVTLS